MVHVMREDMNIIGVMAWRTRNQQSYQRRITSSCWWNGWRPRSTTTNCFPL